MYAKIWNKSQFSQKIKKACSEKKKQTKKTKKNKKLLEVPPAEYLSPASKSKSSSIDIKNDSRTVVYLSNPTQKKENASRNSSNNYKKMQIKEFKNGLLKL